MKATSARADAHFETERVQVDLNRLSARGGAAMIAAQAGIFVVNTGATIVLARLLAPRDFGLVAMAATLMNVVRTFKDLGLANAVVQRPELTHAQVSTAFWINLRLSAALAAVIGVAAPTLAWFYGEPLLIPITLTLGVGVLTLAVSALHVGLLRRQLRFGALAGIEASATAGGVVAALVAAGAGAGVWALVLQTLVFNLTQTAGLWVACRWRPGRARDQLAGSEAGVRALRTYGRYVAWGRFVEYLGRNADSIIVGRLAGAGALGLYDKAFQWSTLPFRQLYSPLVNVAVASLSRVQGDAERYRASFRSVLRALFTVTFPALVFLVVAAESVVLLLLGPKWMSAVPLFRILSVAAFMTSVSRVTSWVYLAEGRTRDEFWWNVATTPVLLVGVGVGSRWGVTGVAAGYTIAVAVLTYPALRTGLRASPLRIADCWSAAWRPGVASIVAGVSASVVGSAPERGGAAPATLLVTGSIYLTVYLLCFAVTHGGRHHIAEVLRLIRSVRAPARQDAPATEDA